MPGIICASVPSMIEAFKVKNRASKMVILAVLALDYSSLGATAASTIQSIIEGSRGSKWLSVLLLVDTLGESGSQVVEINAGNRYCHGRLGELDLDAPGTIEDFVRSAMASFDKESSTHFLLRAHGDGVAEKHQTVERWSPPEIGLEIRRRRLERTNPLSKDLLEDENDLIPNLDNSNVTPLACATFARALKNGLGGKKLGALFFDSCFDGSIEAIFELKDLADYFVAPEQYIGQDRFPYHGWLASLAEGDDPEAVASKAVDAYVPPSSGQELTDFADPTRIATAFAELVGELDAKIGAKAWVPQAVEKLSPFDQPQFCDLGALLSYLKKEHPNQLDVTKVDAVIAELAKVRVRRKPGHLSGVSILLTNAAQPVRAPLPNYRSLAFNLKTGWYEYLFKGSGASVSRFQRILIGDA